MNSYNIYNVNNIITNITNNIIFATKNNKQKYYKKQNNNNNATLNKRKIHSKNKLNSKIHAFKNNTKYFNNNEILIDIDKCYDRQFYFDDLYEEYY